MDRRRHDRGSRSRFFVSDERNEESLEVPGDGTIKIERQAWFFEAPGPPDHEYFVVVVSFGMNASAGLFAAWLYDKLKGRREKFHVFKKRTESTEIKVDGVEIKRTVTEHFEASFENALDDLGEID